jgi:hypothetical protein
LCLNLVRVGKLRETPCIKKKLTVRTTDVVNIPQIFAASISKSKLPQLKLKGNGVFTGWESQKNLGTLFMLLFHF